MPTPTVIDGAEIMGIASTAGADITNSRNTKAAKRIDRGSMNSPPCFMCAGLNELIRRNIHFPRQNPLNGIDHRCRIFLDKQYN